MPRPLHATDMCSPIKMQNNPASPVGADQCVGPLHAKKPLYKTAAFSFKTQYASLELPMPSTIGLQLLTPTPRREAPMSIYILAVS